MRKMKCKKKNRSGNPRGRPAEHPVRLAVCLMLGCFMALLSGSLTVRASGEQEAPVFDYAAQYEASGAPALFELLPEETRRGMEAIGVGGGGEAPMTSATLCLASSRTSLAFWPKTYRLDGFPNTFSI